MIQSSKSPLISIITPTFNHSAYINMCIESVINQTYSNWEQIIIDDGSTDDTFEKARNFSLIDERIKVINQTNKGIFRLSETYNLALGLCKGEFIAILEGDDYWYHDKLELQINEFIHNKSLVLVYGISHGKVENFEKIHNSYPIFDKSLSDFYNNSPRCSIFNVVTKQFLAPLTFLIKKDAIAEIGGFKQILPFPAVDLNTILSLSKLGPFCFIDKPLGVWRISINQTTKTKNIEILEGSNLILTEFLKSLNDTEKKGLNVSLKDLENSYRSRYIITYSRAGRFNLIRKKFKEARTLYIKSICSFGFIEPMWKIRSIVGLIFSYFKWDIELLAHYFGKGRVN